MIYPSVYDECVVRMKCEQRHFLCGAVIENTRERINSFKPALTNWDNLTCTFDLKTDYQVIYIPIM